MLTTSNAKRRLSKNDTDNTDTFESHSTHNEDNGDDDASLSRTPSTMNRRSIVFRHSSDLDFVGDEKLQQIEKEIDRLPHEIKSAYMIALVQEIKQKSMYVRNRKFIQMFLRRDGNVKMAALRMAKFFQHKLELFGVEKLPCRIVLEDLNEKDRIVLLSGFLCVNCGTDVRGNRVVVIRRDILRVREFLNDAYATNIQRVAFFQCMNLIEDHDRSQTKGVRAVFWDLCSSLPLKIYQTFFVKIIRMAMTSLPIKFLMVHFCYNTNLERVVVEWRKAILEMTVFKDAESNIMTHDGSSWECICELSHFGIKREKLPISDEGIYHVKDSIHLINEQLHSEMQCSSENEKFDVNDKSREIYSESGNESALIMIRRNIDDDARNFTLEINEQLHIQGQTGPENEMISRTDESSEHGSEDGEKHIAKTNADTCVKKRDKIEKSADVQNSTLEKPVNKRNSLEVTFPERLMSIIEEKTSTSSIWWINNGTAIQINKESFAGDIIPKHYQGIQFSSFLRNLKRWGFKRLDYEKYLVYAHPFFKQDSRELLKLMSKNEQVDQKKMLDEDLFPAKLMRLLNSGLYSSCIWFLADGQSFVIDQNCFTHKVLQEIFEGIQFSSFLRSLKRWKFIRVASQKVAESNILVYRHPLFQRDKPHLLNNLLAQKVSKKESEPNLKSVDKRKEFLLKLMRILENGEKINVACWQPGGEVFQIHMEAFARDILPKEFEDMDLKFFFVALIQLNFKHLEKPEYINSHFTVFHHPLFQNNAKHLLDAIVENSFIPNGAKYKTEQCNTDPFTLPQKMMKILQNDANHNDVWWLSNGAAFAVKKVNYPHSALAKELQGIQFDSFIRSIQRW